MERGRFLVLLRMVHGGRRESQDVRKRKRPCVETGFCCLRRSIGAGKGALMEAWAPHLLLGPHGRVPVLSALPLRRLEFLSPWGGSVLCFHHSVFMVT